eukprot:scaffold242621_cov30-Tisochrysis_lutea.AAC.1
MLTICARSSRARLVMIVVPLELGSLESSESSAEAPPHWPLIIWFKLESANRLDLAMSSLVCRTFWCEFIARPHKMPVMPPRNASKGSRQPIPKVGLMARTTMFTPMVRIRTRAGIRRIAAMI